MCSLHDDPPFLTSGRYWPTSPYPVVRVVLGVIGVARAEKVRRAQPHEPGEQMGARKVRVEYAEERVDR
jgi:hypothetical protein